MASVKLSAKAVGSTVKLNIDGTAREFIIVHRGLPSTLYDESCDGIWLWLKDALESRAWAISAPNNGYQSYDIHTYLNGTWMNKLDTNIRSQVKSVKIPCTTGGYGTTIVSGANGLNCKVFLLSGYEVGWTNGNDQHLPIDGAVLDYFKGTSAIDSKRIAYLNGSAINWGLRSQYTNKSSAGWGVSPAGGMVMRSLAGSTGILPCLILPDTLMVSGDGTVTTNTAPTAPASITVPERIDGGSSITVSWAASADAENNLEGYKLERSTDGGSTWTQVYQGAGTSAVCAVAFGTESVMYRVRAYDSAGESSGWRTSGQVTVVNNTAPEAPSSITVPLTVLGGGPLAIAWGAARDADGDLAGYALERQADGGAWTEVYRGDAQTFTDAVTRGWATVAYRVRAYDGHGAYSGYTASTAREVNNNTAPAIQCEQESGADLGAVSEGFSIDYSASDADGDAVAVTEAVDGKPLRQFTAGAGQAYTFAVTGETFMKLLNGPHALTVTASDGQAEGVHRLAFTKSVTAASVTLAEPMEADAPITICVLSVTGHIPEDAAYHVKVTNNANDEAPVWEDCTAEVKKGGNHIFANETAANGFAFNFKVTAERGGSGESGYITSVQGGFQ